MRADFDLPIFDKEKLEKVEKIIDGICSNCSDYIFWPGKCGVNENLTPKELAKRILKDSKEKIIYL